MTERDLETSVPDWLIEHPAILPVLQELGIDHSCGGKSLAYACEQQGLDTTFVLAALREAIEANQTRNTLSQHQNRNPIQDTPMATHHAQPAEIVDVRPLGSDLTGTQTRTLFKTPNLEAVRMVMQAGKEISEHEAPGEIVVQCLEGKIAFTALGRTEELEAGQLLYLAPEEPHSVKCIEDASFLLTILLNR